MDDVLIVGAGLAGAAVAWHLQGRARVRVLDQAGQPATEASAQNAGMQRRLAHDPVERALACRAGVWLADPPEGVADGLRRVGAAVVGEGLAEAAADLRARGVRVLPLDTRPPALAGAPAATGWWVPDEQLIDGTHLARALLAGTPVQRATVRGLRVEGGRVVGVDTEAGPLRAGVTVLATGAWSARLARAHGLDRPLIPLARHLLHGAPHPLSDPDHPWVWLDDLGLYARPEGGGWLCSPCDETAREPAPGPGSAGPVDPLIRALAMAKLSAHLPALADLRFTRGWTGLRTFAPDRRPVVGPDPELPGLAWAAGLGGFGVTCAVAVGELLATLLDGGAPGWVDPAAVAPGRAFPGPLVPATLDLARYSAE